MKEKIAFVTPSYLPSNLFGSDMYVRVLAEELAQRGHDVSVIASNALEPEYWYNPFLSKKIPVPIERIKGVQVYRLPCNQFFTLCCFFASKIPFLPNTLRSRLQLFYQGPALIGFSKLLQEKHFSIIHVSPSPLYINTQVVDETERLYPKPKVIITPFFHTKVASYHTDMLTQILNRSDVVHVVTNSEAQDVLKRGVKKEKVVVIPLFLDMKGMHDNASLEKDVARFKKTHSIEHKKIVLFAGLKGSMKGAVDVLAAMRVLAQKKNYALVSMGHNTKEWNTVIRKKDSSFLVDLGYKKGKEKEIVFAACDIFCMPSKSDSFGMVYLEAWHKKKPVIAADIPAVRELVLGNNGGTLVPYGNIRTLTTALEELIEDPVLSRKLGMRGNTALHKKFALSSTIKKYQQMFA